MAATKSATMDASSLFDQAVETYEAALKTGVKIQEETTRWWSQMMTDLGSPQNWQQRAQQVLNDAIPTAQKSFDESVKVMNQNAATCLDLLQKAMETGQSESMADAQNKTRQLWESSLNALRTNTQAMISANGRIMESWAALARQNGAAAQ